MIDENEDDEVEEDDGVCSEEEGEHRNQEEVADHGGGAGQELVGLLAGGVLHREGVLESEVGCEGVGPVVVVDSIRDQIG
ncbi:hypothetical protein D8674_021337 [Pyrus ussuriensis x Pyrus communis]|uniref:Uncharacterized protein n=1 Tax=Pyrus ussuriensis x Pyrus communis TaxID=2448454 RepID=A0A5N5GGW4_9ROSA|nr:hypothetical protein D8674_021337 [Pyrus ussuriensis x Pyrus communis]